MKKISKKSGITIFTVLMVILAVIIVCYSNPLANPVDEVINKETLSEIYMVDFEIMNIGGKPLTIYY